MPIPLLGLLGGMGLLGAGNYARDKYEDSRRAGNKEEFLGLLGNEPQHQLPIDQAGPQIQGSGWLGGEMGDKEFAARAMTIPGYERMGAGLLDAYTNPATTKPYYTPIQTSTGFYGFNNRTGDISPLGVEGQGGPLLPMAVDPRAQANVAGARTTAEERARAAVGRETESAKKAIGAANLLDLIKEAEGLLPKATGSLTGKGLDAAAGAMGISTEGAKASARLKVIAGGLTMAQPRMEGPQSDYDQKLYKEMAGQVGDETIPIETRLAALEQIKILQTKYAKQSRGGAKMPLAPQSQQQPQGGAPSSGGWGITKL